MLRTQDAPTDLKELIVQRLRLGRHLGVVRFLLEDESSYITGALYTVNGGMFT